MRGQRRQYSLQAAIGQRVSSEEVRHPGQAHATDRSGQHGLHVVAGHRRGKARSGIAFDARQLPGMQLSGGGVTETQRGMHAQLAHITGRAMRLQVARRRTEDETKAAQSPCGQAGIGQFTTAYHRVQAFADHIDDAVVEVQFQLHLRIALLEAGQHRQQEAVPDGGQADAQQPAGGMLSLRQVRLCFGKLVQCTPTAL